MKCLDAVFRECKPAAASWLKTDERACVNYARRGKQRVAISIVILPSGKTARARKGAGHVGTGVDWPCGSASSRRRLPHHRHAFRDFRLLVGSEGTLALISEGCLRQFRMTSSD
jgi:hypothetical protein